MIRKALLRGAPMLVPFLVACGDDGSTIALADLGVMEFSLPDGSRMQLSVALGKTATLFLTLDPECPMTLGYAPLFDSLQRTLPKGVSMVGFYPAPFIVPDSAQRFVEAHHFGFTQLMDPECALAEALLARVTPEAFLVDSVGTVLYRGAIDDSAVREGRKRTPSKFHLANALRSLAAGETIKDKEVNALGCIVECPYNGESNE